MTKRPSSSMYAGRRRALVGAAAALLVACSSGDGKDCGGSGQAACASSTTIGPAATSSTIPSTTPPTTPTSSLPLTTIEGLSACCLPGKRCQQRGRYYCERNGGTWHPGDWDCSFTRCPSIPPPCGGPTPSTSLYYDAPSLWTIRFSLAEPINIGALQLDVDYSAPCGYFVGEADGVQCERLSGLSGSISTFNNESAQQLLRVGVIDLDGFAGPADLFECRFNDAASTVSASDIHVTVLEATTIDFVPIEPLPTITVTIAPVYYEELP